jgi:hypothetical protein
MKDFVPYEQALELDELGFDEPCFAYYNIDPQLKAPAFNMVKPFEHEWCLPAPIYQQAFRWFREKYRLVQEITVSVNGFYYIYGHFYDSNGALRFDIRPFTGELVFFETYEEAELACLRKLISLAQASQ